MLDEQRLYQEKINQYISAHTEPEDLILAELDRETHLKILMPRMLSGHVQGKMLEFYSRLIKPMFVLEIGTYTGYSAICLAKGLQKGGKLHTIEINDEIANIPQKYFSKAGMQDCIQLHIGDAIDIIPTLDIKFDLIFIDGDKRIYSEYFDMCLPKLRKGGIMLADNVLWDGKVVENIKKMDTYTKGILDFNHKVQNDKRVRNFLLPVRDGIMVIEKI